MLKNSLCHACVCLSVYRLIMHRMNWPSHMHICHLWICYSVDGKWGQVIRIKREKERERNVQIHYDNNNRISKWWEPFLPFVSLSAIAIYVYTSSSVSHTHTIQFAHFTRALSIKVAHFIRFHSIKFVHIHSGPFQCKRIYTIIPANKLSVEYV